MADTDEMSLIDPMDEWDYEDEDFEIPCEAELERQREEFKENIKRQVDKIIRSNVSSSAQKFEHTVIKLRSINTLTTYPTTPFDIEEAFE